ncbi:MAG: DUF2157 domain-containing protein [Candidatus Methylacidiphilales bacterium]|nr:DUF2157 domain-containing protein [Candidatus Methylacidiphilales bacterium]
MNQKQLKPHLEEWSRKGLIQPTQAEAILALYPTSGRNYWTIAFAVIGTFLILGGVILILSSNWEDIPDTVKMAGLLALLAASLITGVEAQRRGMNRAWWECGYLGAAVFPLLGLMLVSQIFHVQGKATGLVLVWTLATLPLPLLTRSVSTWVVQILALMSLLICAKEDGYLGARYDFHQWCQVWMAFGGLLALLSQAWHRVGEKIQAGLGEFWGLLMVFIAAYVWGFELKPWFGWWTLVFLGALGLIYRGYLRAKAHQVNMGFVMVALVTLSVFFRLVGTMFNTGLIFIAGGGMIILTVWGLNRIRKQVLGGIG